MADSRRWDASKPARRDDQFVRPPAFRDTHDGDPLKAEAAAWHGSGGRNVAVGVAFALVAGIAAVAFMLFVSPSGGVDAPQGAAASEVDDDASDGLAADVGSQVGAQGNATSSLPLPSMPSVPAAP